MIIKEIYTLESDPTPRVRIKTPGGEEHIYSAVCLVQFARDLLQVIREFEGKNANTSQRQQNPAEK